MFRVYNVIEEETAQPKHKYNTKIDFLDLNTRNIFTSSTVIMSMLKYV